MEKPRVDIIIPVFNVERYLRRCLDSISSQTCHSWRALCIDDGSTDSSLDILKEYSGKDPRFVVKTKPHGGLSDTRNHGLGLVESEYVMFVDPDDSIHFQTIEIALALADRDGTDVVTWRRDRLYKNVQVKFMRILHMDPLKARPWRSARMYDVSKVSSAVTPDLIDHCSDWKHSSAPHTIKHCHVWKQLYRSAAIDGIRFQVGMNFEDIPWWSEVMLCRLSATLTSLPLYYYYPNPKSIVRTMSKVDKAVDLLKGICLSLDLYNQKATPEQMAAWSHGIKWANLHNLSSKLGELATLDSEGRIAKLVDRLSSEGAFEDASSKKEMDCKARFELFGNL